MGKYCFAVLLVALACATADAQSPVRVGGYFRPSTGTYVAPHYRTSPDSSFYNNWSSYGNSNPYTGQLGTRLQPSYSSPSYTPSYRSYSPPFYSPWGR